MSQVFTMGTKQHETRQSLTKLVTRFYVRHKVVSIIQYVNPQIHKIATRSLHTIMSNYFCYFANNIFDVERMPSKLC